MKVKNPHEYGIISLNSEGFVEQITEKPAPELKLGNLINAGIYIFDPLIFEAIEKIDELTAEYYNVLADRGGFFGITNSMLMEGVGEIVAGAVEIGRMLPEIIDDGLTFLSGKALQGVGYVIGEDIEMNDFNIIPSSALIDNYDYYLLEAAKEKGYKSIDELPISVRNEIDRDLRDKAIKTQLYGKKGQSNPYSQYTNQLLKDRSGGVLDNIRDGFRTALGETSTRQWQ